MANRSVIVRLEAQVAQYLAGMDKAAKGTEKVTKLTGEQKKAMSTLAPAVTAVGAATVAGVGLAIKSYADFDKAMSNVRASTHETTENMDLLREAAVVAGADTAFSAVEAAGAIDELAKAGVSTADILGGGLDGALALAAAGELDVARASEIAASAMTQFGLSGQQIPHIADLLAAGAGKAQGSVEDMGAALNQAGLVASSTGLSIEETTGGLAAFASAGLVGSDAGTSFKSMLQRLTPQSDKAAKLMDELGVSAYDANGQFVGLSEYAGILQNALKDMAPEQRNAAMQVLFGADAVRAANVLYTQGAEGIQEWEDAVNDAGYAAETAAMKQDNLAGDIEKLGGSLDSVFLKTGSGANDVLRQLVQGLEGIVDVVGSIPAPILSVGGIIAGVAGGAALLGGAFITAVPKIRETKDALQVLAPAGGKADKALRGLGKAAGIAGAALVALQVAKQVSEAMGDATPAAEQFTNELMKMGNGEAVAGLDALVTRTEGITTEIKGIGEAVAYVGGLNGMDKLGMGIGKVLTLGMGMGTRMEEIVADVEAVDDSIAGLVGSGKTDEAAAAFTRIATEAAKQGMEVEDVLAIFPEYRDALTKTALDAGGTATQQEILNAALGKADPAAVTAAAAQEVMAGAVEETGVAVDGVIESMDTFLEQLFAAGMLTMDSREAQAAYQEQLDSVDDAVQKIIDSNGEMGNTLTKNKKDFDLSTEAGRLANETFQGLAKGGMAEVEAMAAEGLGQDQLQEKLSDTYDDLVATAEAFGMDEQKAKDLAREILGVPDGVKIDSWMSDEAKRVAEETKKAVEAIPTKRTIVFQTDASGFYDPTAGTDGMGAGSGANSKGPRKFAVGGAVYGPGTGTSDSVPAQLSNGEHVLTAAEVQAMGGQQSVYRFRQQLKSGVRGYAEGGAVGSMYAPTQQLIMAGGGGGGINLGGIKIYGATDSDAVRRAVVDEIEWKFQKSGVRVG